MKARIIYTENTYGTAPELVSKGFNADTVDGKLPRLEFPSSLSTKAGSRASNTSKVIIIDESTKLRQNIESPFKRAKATLLTAQGWLE